MISRLRLTLTALLALLLAACTLGPIETPTPRPTPSPTPVPTPTAEPTPSPSPTPAPLPESGVAQVLVDGLRVRNGPGEESDALAVLRVGQRVVITDGPQRAGGFTWYEVSRGRDAARGWVAAADANGDPFLEPVGNGRLVMRYRDGERVGIGLSDADGSNLVVLEGNPLKIEWSRDGSRVAFSMVNPLKQDAEPEVFVMNADGGDRHRIGSGPDFAWAPDGSSVAIAEDRWIILHDPADGRDIGRLPLTLSSVGELTWSPDGAHLAMTAKGSGSDGRDVYVMRSDTGQLTRLTDTGRNGGPAWSPSGLRLVFNAPSGVVMSEVDASDIRPVSEGVVGPQPWSPDGNFLLIARYGSLDRFDLRLQGSGSLARDDDASTVTGGAWSPDGRALLFERVSRSDGAHQAWIVKDDGSDPHALPGTSDLAAWQPVLLSSP
jgi:hypothetical protein